VFVCVLEEADREWKTEKAQAEAQSTSKSVLCACGARKFSVGVDWYSNNAQSQGVCKALITQHLRRISMWWCCIVTLGRQLV